MFHRIINPSKSQSFFLFGARGTGKSTYLLKQWGKKAHYINLLLDQWESRYLRSPDLLIADIQALRPRPKWVIIDEIQKVPKLLDLVHQMIVEDQIHFVCTGSSARKLRRQSANLLAGRAFNYQMHPLTFRELGDSFQLDSVLQWGSLPSIFALNPADKNEYLRSYTQTYLKEEILQEQLVRNGSSFRSFLPVAAQENGNTLNFSKLARDVGIDTKTMQSFFQILEDTLVGFYLPAFHFSQRKSIKLQPKFYLFDLGVKKALEGSLSQPSPERSSGYSKAFEHFLICEVFRLNSYARSDFFLSHYQTNSGGEIDLVLKRGKEVIAIEIKSTERIDPVEVRRLKRVAEPLLPKSIYYVSQDPVTTKIDGVNCLHWKKFLETLF